MSSLPPGFDPYSLCEPEEVVHHMPLRPYRMVPIAELEDNDSVSTLVLPSLEELEEYDRAGAQHHISLPASGVQGSLLPSIAGAVNAPNLQNDAVCQVIPPLSPNWTGYRLRRIGRSRKRGELPLPDRSTLRPVSTNTNQASDSGERHSRHSSNSEAELSTLSSDGSVQRSRRTVTANRRSSMRSSLLAFWDWLVYAPGNTPENTSTVPTQQSESDKHTEAPISQTPTSSHQHASPPPSIELKTFTTTSPSPDDNKFIPSPSFSRRTSTLKLGKSDPDTMAADKLSVQDPFQDPRTPGRRYTAPTSNTAFQSMNEASGNASFMKGYSMESTQKHSHDNTDYEHDPNYFLPQTRYNPASRSASVSTESFKPSRIPKASHHIKTPTEPSPLERRTQTSSAYRSAIPLPVQRRSASSPARAHGATSRELYTGDVSGVMSPSVPSSQPSEEAFGGTTVTPKPDDRKGHGLSKSVLDNDWDTSEEETPKPARTIYTGEYRTPVAERTAQRIHGTKLRISSSADEVMGGTVSQSARYPFTLQSDYEDQNDLDQPLSSLRRQDGIGDYVENSMGDVIWNLRGDPSPINGSQVSYEEADIYPEISAASTHPSVLSFTGAIQNYSQELETENPPSRTQEKDELLRTSSSAPKRGQKDAMSSHKRKHDTHRPEHSHFGYSSIGPHTVVDRYTALHSHPVRSSSLEPLYEFSIQEGGSSKPKSSKRIQREESFAEVVPRTIPLPKITAGEGVRTPVSRNEKKSFSIRNIFKTRAGTGRETPIPRNRATTHKIPVTVQPIRKAVSSKSLGGVMKPAGLAWNRPSLRNTKARTGPISEPIQIPPEQLPPGCKPLPGPNASNMIDLRPTLASTSTSASTHTSSIPGSRTRRGHVITTSSGSPYLTSQVPTTSESSPLGVSTPSRIPIRVKHVAVQTETQHINAVDGTYDWVVRDFVEKHKERVVTAAQRDTCARMVIALARRSQLLGAAERAWGEAIASADSKQKEKEAAEEALSVLLEQLEGFLG
ncbi:uncharacterized protein BO97DRAFT_452812 [Aspergillus homomorphus CBS 101889]|uniref:Uncharacterized protein n=1 Tax=Aspergillus homomorphus (strain CBS 101889) TaxID=1450537 RepID=A0A395IA01_ASPHC|nr:hypothetical protein BO97DRAFT_452812 [Aspergillus homomorphus CBS 101889]RAL16851.1 hypothetical protein BO97DRAFT_452812 [Aspergillus homomorphus CBS 101889]